jgi:uncharacterized membrane protein
MTTATGPDIAAGQRHNGSGTPRRSEERRAQTGESRTGSLPGPERAARALGWFSIGLGLAEVAAPRRLARLIGVEDDDTHRNFLLAYGLREIAAGVAILAADRPTGAVWARVGGDVMDLAFLGQALSSDASARTRVAATTAAVLGVTALDVLTGRRLGRQLEWRGAGGAETERRGTAIAVQESITIARPPEEVYRFWRDFQHLPQFMEHLESVQVLDERRSHWRASAPGGSSVEWDAEIVEDRPNQRIVWRSVGDADVPNTGTVRFAPAPGNRGTEIHVELRYEPPGGKAGALVAKLFGEEPSQQVKSDLRRLKQVLETGEVVHSDASVHRGMHAAQPSAAAGTRGDGR